MLVVSDRIAPSATRWNGKGTAYQFHPSYTAAWSRPTTSPSATPLATAGPTSAGASNIGLQLV